MSEKRKLHHILKNLHKLALWQLVLLFLLMLVISASLLRLNSIGMLERRDAVIAADKTGDNAIIVDRLAELQNYVSSHMNTDMGAGVELTESYKRDEAANVAATQPPANVNIYKEATQHCQQTSTSSYKVYDDCVFNYLNSIPGGTVVATSINSKQLIEALYVYKYAAPLWSPDLAGFSVLLTILLVVVILARFLAIIIIRLILKSQYKSI